MTFSPASRPLARHVPEKTKAGAVASVLLSGRFHVPNIHSEDACAETDV
jgi:hypothetical protein